MSNHASSAWSDKECVDEQKKKKLFRQVAIKIMQFLMLHERHLVVKNVNSSVTPGASQIQDFNQVHVLIIDIMYIDWYTD